MLVAASVEIAQAIRDRVAGPKRSVRQMMREASERAATVDARLALLEERVADIERDR